MIIAFYGHREVQQPENVRKWLVKIVEDLVFEGANCFFIGGYGQFDAMAAGVVLNLKQKYPHIRSVLVLPYLDRKYDATMYDETIFPPFENVPRQYAVLSRNEYMVDCADIIVAYVNYNIGGAARTLQYAERKHKRIIRV